MQDDSLNCFCSKTDYFLCTLKFYLLGIQLARFSLDPTNQQITDIKKVWRELLNFGKQTIKLKRTKSKICKEGKEGKDGYCKSYH